jgi:hypothetical protein
VFEGSRAQRVHLQVCVHGTFLQRCGPAAINYFGVLSCREH